MLDGRKQMVNGVILRDKLKKEFLNHLFAIDYTNPYEISMNDNTFICSNQNLYPFIKRMEEGKVTIVPYKQKSSIHWLILAPNLRELSIAHGEIKQFLTPFYIFSIPLQVQQFNEGKSKIGKLGKQLYPGGYLSFKTDLEKESIIWKQLSIWNKLDSRRPKISYEELEVTAFTLRNKFQNAIAIQDWKTSKTVLLELKQGHYISDENLMFLQLQLLSAQLNWENIWESEDYELITGLDNIPKKVRYTLLNAFYQSVLIQTDLETNFLVSYENYKKYRYRLGTLIRSQLGLDEEETLRIFAYEAGFKGNEEKLLRYSEKTNDKTTKALIDYLLSSLSIKEAESPDPVRTKEEQALLCYQQQQYEDALILLIDSPLSITKVNLLSGIAVMNESEETCTLAYDSFASLSLDEQSQLLNDPMSKAQIKFVLRWNENKGITLPVDDDEEIEIYTWNDWFKALIQGEDSNRLDLELYKMDEQEGTIQWSLPMLKQLTEQITEIALTDLSSDQKILIETALSMFINELLQDRHFPNPRAFEIYEYVTETMLIYCKKNEANTKVFLRLLDGLLSMDLTRINDYWKRVYNWFNFQPTLKLSNYLLDSLEMFIEYGLVKEHLHDLWVHWTTVLLNQFNQKHITQIESWVKVGQQIAFDPQLIERLLEKLVYEPEEDSITSLPPLTISIFSLREKPAVRAAKRIMDRNSSLNLRVCTDDKLTNEAKTFARNSDIIILVTTCMSHALTYGIGPHIRGKILYSRSSGETSIVEALENYTY